MSPFKKAKSRERKQPKWGKKIAQCCAIPQRMLLAFMGFYAIVNCYAVRVCLSHVITVLVIKENHEIYNATDIDMYRYCTRDNNFDMFSGTYDWSEILQGYILSSFYIGYMITQLPSVLLTDRFGGKWILIVGMLLSGLSSFFSPIGLEKGGPNALMGLRAIMGMGHGLVFPSINGLISSWIPENERDKMGAVVITAGVMGTFIGYIMSGIVLDNYHWSVVFTVSGISTLLWCPFFIIFCYSYPATHPCLNIKEMEYLNDRMDSLDRVKRPRIPWMAIITSGPIWALIFVQAGHDWGMSLIVNDLPKYFSQVQGIPVLKNGVYTSMPFLFYGVTAIAFGYIGDCMLLHDYMGVTSLRKLMTTIASWGPAVFIISASYVACDRLLMMILFTLCIGCMGPYFTGMKLTPMDLSPNNAGPIMAITNSIGAGAAFLAPVMAGYLIPDANLFQFRLVFWIAFAILFFTAFVFLLFGSSEVQPYDDPDYRRREINDDPPVTTNPFG